MVFQTLAFLLKATEYNLAGIAFEINTCIEIAHNRQRLRKSAATGSLTMYICSTACSGIGTPAIAPMSRAQAPAQLMTFSQRINSPLDNCTPCTAPLCVLIAVQATPSRISSPCGSRSFRIGHADVNRISLPILIDPECSGKIFRM